MNETYPPGTGVRLPTHRGAFFRILPRATLLFALTATLLGCGALLGDSKPRRITVNSPTLTLAWDPPVSARGTNGVSGYRVYYRPHGSPIWRLIDTIEASDHPAISIRHPRIGYGSYEFAVEAIGYGGAVSGRHTSLDIDADPASGWYVNWYGPPDWYAEWQNEE